MENKEFDLRNYLYNNTLLKEEKEVSDKARREAEEEGYEDGYDDAVEDAKDALDKIKDETEESKDKKKDVKEVALRKAIQNEIISILSEQEEEDVDVDKEVDVDVEDKEEVDVNIDKEVDIDDESEESKIEVDSELAGEDTDTVAVLGLLTKAQEEAESLGDEKLMDQIGNTITYFTRAHVVKSTETRAVAENKRFRRRRK